MSSLCNLATKLPILIGSLLDREDKLKRGRFREETLTDIFTGSLAAFAGPNLVIEYPDEATTGSDIDLDFWNVASGEQLSVRIQAKRLNAKKHSGKDVNIEIRAYSHLLHKPNPKADYQFETLLNEANGRLPLYMFYNHGEVTHHAAYLGVYPRVRGINLAFANDIGERMQAELDAKPKRPNYKRLSQLRPYFFELENIFCSTKEPGEMVPSPQAVAQSLDFAWRRVFSDDTIHPAIRVRRRILERGPSSYLREAGRRVMDGPAIRTNREVQRPTITLISGRSQDALGPEIYDESDFA